MVYSDLPEVVDHTHMNAITLAPDGDILFWGRQFSDVQNTLEAFKNSYCARWYPPLE